MIPSFHWAGTSSFSQILLKRPHSIWTAVSMWLASATPKSVFILVLTAISYGELIVDRPHSLIPPIRSRYLRPNHHYSQLLQSDVWTLLTSLTLKSESGTASRITISSARSHRIIHHCLNRRRDPSQKPARCFFNSTFKISLTFTSYTKTMQMAWENVVEVSLLYGNFLV